MLIEAGPSDVHPLVRVPMGLIWLMGGRRDRSFRTTAQPGAAGRAITVPRGRMLGGSGSINSMVWFRGRAADFDEWQVPGWGWGDVAQGFEAVEAALRPTRMPGPHPLSQALDALFDGAAPTPDHESAGVVRHNLRRGQRRSAATAFLRDRHDIVLRVNAPVDRLIWSDRRAVGVVLADGSKICAARGVILCAGALASPAILMRSGVGPRADLARLGIDPRLDSPEIGANLHDHPGVGLHFEGDGSGYGLAPAQWPAWALAPLRYAVTRGGPFASPTVEACAFFSTTGRGVPDIQSHFIPFHLAHQGPRFQRKSGYFADICLCRPKSRGQLRLAAKDPKAPPEIDLGLFTDGSDLDTMVAGVDRLRALLGQAPFGDRRAPDVWPGETVTGAALKDHIRAHAGTAYHPVGTLRLVGPVTPRLRVAGTDGLWVADASVMPQVTSANTNAPAMMIGWRGAQMITEDAA